MSCSVCEDIDGDIAGSSDWMEKASVLLTEIGFPNSFIRAGSYGRNTVQVGSSEQRQVVKCRLLHKVQFV